MAGDLPQYQPRQTLGSGPEPGVRAITLPDVPTMPDVGAADRALSGFGAELSAVATKLQQGQQHTLASQGMEQFITERAALQQKYVADPDFTTAEKRFGDDIATAQRNALEKISDPVLRSRISLEMTRAALTSGNAVHTAQVASQVDTSVAANDTLMQTSLIEATTAKSPSERAAAVDRVTADLERLHAAGLIDARTAVARTKSFANQLDHADALTLVKNNPAAAREALANPAMFRSLDPVTRASLTLAAEGKQDANTTATIVNAANFHPEAATLAIGHTVAPDHAGKIFDNGIVAIESGGDNTVVSPKGALGASQIMPATAREVATKLGLADVAALSDADLKSRLLSDQTLNLKLGRAYWQQQVTRYDGNVALAAVAYNAGPTRADAWKAAAEEKYGAAFSPAQLASVVDVKEARDYLGKLYGKFNVPMDLSFSSPAATLHAASAVGAVLTQQAAREAHLTSVLASSGAESDPVADVVKAGFDVDPSRIATFRSQQQAAAAKGDMAAAKRLQDLDNAERMQPLIRQAWSMPPAALEESVNNLEAQIAAPGGNPTQTAINSAKAFRKVLDDQVKRRDSEPVVLGGANGGRFYELAPLPGDAPLDDTLTATLKGRDAQATIAHQRYGGSGSPFTVQEAAAWHQRYTEATPQERAAIVGQFANGLSPQTFAAALPQLVKGSVSTDDRPALTIAAGLFGVAPDVAQGVIEGLDAVKTDSRYLPSKGANKLSYITAKDEALPAVAFNRAARTDPAGPFAALSNAIDARYAYLSAQAKDVSESLNTSRLKQATNEVTGGVLYQNGAPLIAPIRGMSQRDFDATVWGLGDHDLAGAQTTSGSKIDAAFLRSQAKLVSRSDGEYYLQVNRDDDRPQYAVTKGGAPFVLDLRNRQMAPIDSAGPFDLSGAQP